MRDPHESPDPEQPADKAAQPQGPASTADPTDLADLGTAYGMELAIGSSTKQAPAEEEVPDPLAWMRRGAGHNNAS